MNKAWFEIRGSSDDISVTKIPMYHALENCFYDLKKLLNDYSTAEILASHLQVEQRGYGQPEITAYLLIRNHRYVNRITHWEGNKKDLERTVQQWLDNRKSVDKYPSDEEIEGVKKFLSYLEVNKWVLIEHDHILINDSLQKKKEES